LREQVRLLEEKVSALALEQRRQARAKPQRPARQKP